MSRIASATLAAPRRIAATTGIAQDNIIFAAVLFAFVVWITSKGELPTYIAFFKPGASQGPTPVPVTASSTMGAASTAAAAPLNTILNAVQGAGKTLGNATGASSIAPTITNWLKGIL